MEEVYNCEYETYLTVNNVYKILTTYYYNGADMRRCFCYFREKLSSYKIDNTKNGILLSKKVQKFIKNIEKINEGEQGSIYKAEIMLDENKVILKIPKNETHFEGYFKEYFLGAFIMNKMRYYIPTFMYTLGSFICPYEEIQSLIGISTIKSLCNKNDKTTIFVMYEQIEGETMMNLLTNNNINFEEYLEVFIQLCVSLEIAQREVNFTHFDLHVGNLMVKKVKNLQYNVNLDLITYNFKVNLLPIVVDYGFSTATIDGKTISVGDYEQYGMMKFMVPGNDLYKFLIYSVYYTTNNILREKIIELFNFYGTNDEYNIVKTKMVGIDQATKEFCLKGTFSNIAKYIPLMTIEWLYINYKSNIEKYLTFNFRENFIHIHFPTIFSNKNPNPIICSEEQIENINKISTTSYILFLYNIYCNTQDKNFSMPEETKNELIKTDITLLMKYKNISLPTQEDINKSTKNILDFTLLVDGKIIKNCSSIDIDTLNFYTELQPYFQMFFTIRELDIETYYNEFLSDFVNSPHYKLYEKNTINISQALRWCKN